MNETDYLNTTLELRQSHLKLDDDCKERGGSSTQHRGVLAQYLNTPIYGRPIDLCHTCHNDKCSNPEHLYWGSRKENIDDAKRNGTWHNVWDRMVSKYGYEEACKMQARPPEVAAKGGKASRKKSD